MAGAAALFFEGDSGEILQEIERGTWQEVSLTSPLACPGGAKPLLERLPISYTCGISATHLPLRDACFRDQRRGRTPLRTPERGEGAHRAHWPTARTPHTAGAP